MGYVIFGHFLVGAWYAFEHRVCIKKMNSLQRSAFFEGFRRTYGHTIRHSLTDKKITILVVVCNFIAGYLCLIPVRILFPNSDEMVGTHKEEAEGSYTQYLRREASMKSISCADDLICALYVIQGGALLPEELKHIDFMGEGELTLEEERDIASFLKRNPRFIIDTIVINNLVQQYNGLIEGQEKVNN